MNRVDIAYRYHNGGARARNARSALCRSVIRYVYSQYSSVIQRRRHDIPVCDAYIYKKAFSRSINEGGKRIRMFGGKRGGSSDVVTRNFIIQLECKVSVGFKRATGGQTVPRSYFEAGLPCRTHFYPTQHCISSLTRRISCAKPDARKQGIKLAGM